MMLLRRGFLAASVGLLCAAQGVLSKKCGGGQDLPADGNLRIGVLHRPEEASRQCTYARHPTLE